MEKEIEEYDGSGITFALYGTAAIITGAIGAVLGFIIGYFWN